MRKGTNDISQTAPSFVGVGFGAIQAGLFLFEAQQTRAFTRLVVAEVLPEVVDAVRNAGGRYMLNIATPGGIERHEVSGIEMYNPAVPADRAKLVEAIACATEIATALPSVAFYDTGGSASAAALLADGIRQKLAAAQPVPALIYTAENDNHAAEILDALLCDTLGVTPRNLHRAAQCLNTVIGKMSGVVTDAAQMTEQWLAPMCPGLLRCFLVEEFNRILITKTSGEGFRRHILVFEEREDLLPFEEAKLYGHNATHALIGYLAHERGCQYIADAAHEGGLMRFARDAFIEESGAALCRKHAGVDPLFTPEGYQAYADDLLIRMVNPYLRDAVARVIRDPKRKLGWNDRLIGTMRLALGQGIEPRRYARAAAAAVRAVQADDPRPMRAVLDECWRGAAAGEEDRQRITQLISEARQ